MLYLLLAVAHVATSQETRLQVFQKEIRCYFL